MLKNRNAQGMSIKIIIVAIIGLIILLIVVLMLTGKISDFGGGLKSVGDPAKTCSEQSESERPTRPSDVECPSTDISILFRDTGEEKTYCCKPKNS